MRVVIADDDAVARRVTRRALLEAGADPNVEQEGGHTPLDAAIHHQDTEMEALLRDHGVRCRRRG